MPQIKSSNLSGWNLTRENKAQNHYVRTKTKHLKWPNRILCWTNIKEDDEDVIYPIRTHASAGWWWILDAIRSTVWNWRALKAVTLCTITIPWGCQWTLSLYNSRLSWQLSHWHASTISVDNFNQPWLGEKIHKRHIVRHSLWSFLLT
jgi:hypothetical protein